MSKKKANKSVKSVAVKSVKLDSESILAMTASEILKSDDVKLFINKNRREYAKRPILTRPLKCDMRNFVETTLRKQKSHSMNYIILLNRIVERYSFILTLSTIRTTLCDWCNNTYSHDTQATLFARDTKKNTYSISDVATTRYAS